MKTTTSTRAFSYSKQLAFTALFAALCLTGTLVIVIPLPMGFFNVGDVFVLLSGWFLGPIYGSIAAGMGSALADIIAGYSVYAPFTFLIKALDALAAYFVWRLLKTWIRKEQLDVLPRLISAILAEMIMVLGYFLTEMLLYGFAGAVGTLAGNGLQGVCCLTLATAVLSLIYSLKGITRMFPHLKVE